MIIIKSIKLIEDIFFGRKWKYMQQWSLETYILPSTQEKYKLQETFYH